MQFTITEAAKLYQKQRKTLYRHIESGQLSPSSRGDGRTVIDFSELLRCYGEPPSSPRQSDTEKTHDNSHTDTLLTQAVLDELKAMREAYQAILQENRRQSEQLEALRQELRQLPAPAKQEKPAGKRHDFSDLLEKLKQDTENG